MGVKYNVLTSAILAMWQSLLYFLENLKKNVGLVKLAQ